MKNKSYTFRVVIDTEEDIQQDIKDPNNNVLWYNKYDEKLSYR